MERLNLHSPQFEYDDSDPEGYRCGAQRFGPTLGAEQMGTTHYEIPGGQSICPYHYEVPEEEWLIVVVGNVILRHPEGEDELVPGDVVCFPSGPSGAHKVTNRGTETARVLMYSTRVNPNIAVYPDSNKIGVNTGYPEDHVRVRRGTVLDYYDGEV
jgi:uncharacterized cupin superfamily protein